MMDGQVVEIEYETIVQESSDSVVFRIDGKEVLLSKNSMDEYDYEGRVWVDKETANRMGL